MKVIDENTVPVDWTQRRNTLGLLFLYVVHGNTYYGGYGHVENIFGVYTEKDSAEAAKDLIEKRLYEENKDRERSIVDDLSDIAVGILEIEANEILDIELGGYCE